MNLVSYLECLMEKWILELSEDEMLSMLVAGHAIMYSMIPPT